MNSITPNKSDNIHILEKKQFWIGLGLVIAAFLFTFGQTFPMLVHTWLGRSDYSHGFLVPLISIYLAWVQRRRLAEIPITPNILLGLPITILATFMLILGQIGSVVIVQEVSLLLIMPGMVLLLLGTSYLKALALPLGYLILMVPVLDPMLDRFKWPMQLFSATFAGMVLQYFDFPVIRNANYIELPTITLEVADICSGVSYLVSIIAVGIPLAQLTQTTRLRKVVLISIAILIGILANAVRVTMVGVLASKGFEGPTHGPGHILHGVFVSQVGFVALFIMAWLLSRTQRQHSPKIKTPTSSWACNGISVYPRKLRVAWLTAIVLLLTPGIFLHLYTLHSVPLKRDLQDFPSVLGKWTSAGTSESGDSYTIPGADNEMVKRYRDAEGQEVTLHIGYFESQDQERELVNYRLGWLYKNASGTDIVVKPYDHIKLNQTILNNKGEKSIALYWYYINGRIVADNYRAKAVTILDGLILNRTNGAIVIVMMNPISSGNMQQAGDELAEFAGLIVPVLQQYIP